jgi:hypothetical protein
MEQNSINTIKFRNFNNNNDDPGIDNILYPERDMLKREVQDQGNALQRDVDRRSEFESRNHKSVLKATQMAKRFNLA